MKTFLPVILLFLLIASCGEKKKSLAGNEKVVSLDFFQAFPKLKLPFTIADSSINTVKTDSTSISYSQLTQLISDTALTKTFQNDTKLTINPIGKYEVKGKENYLVVEAKSKKKTAVFLLVFDRKQKFSASMPIAQTAGETDTFYSTTIDNRLAISRNKEWKKNEELLYNRTIYSYNDVGTFTVVMTETNDQSGTANKINNPLDTFPKKNKYSGDYIKGKKSILSIRDGKTKDRYLFYVHFENEEEEQCNGELRGGFVLKSPTSAIFSENNDPCVIDFTFNNNSVFVKEQGSCGSHRGIKCFFNDTYTKKKEPKATRKK